MHLQSCCFDVLVAVVLWDLKVPIMGALNTSTDD